MLSGDYRRSALLMKECANKGLKKSYLQVAKFYQEGWLKDDKDNSKAINYYLKAVEFNSRNADVAFVELTKMAEGGNYEATCQAVKLQYEGKVSKDVLRRLSNELSAREEARPPEEREERKVKPREFIFRSRGPVLGSGGKVLPDKIARRVRRRPRAGVGSRSAVRLSGVKNLMREGENSQSVPVLPSVRGASVTFPEVVEIELPETPSPAGVETLKRRVIKRMNQIPHAKPKMHKFLWVKNDDATQCLIVNDEERKV